MAIEGSKVTGVISCIDHFDWYAYCPIQGVIMQLVYIHQFFHGEVGLFAYYSFYPDHGVVFYQCFDIPAGYMQVLYSTDMFLYNMCTSTVITGGLSKYWKNKAQLAFDNYREDYFSWNNYNVSCEDRIISMTDGLMH